MKEAILTMSSLSIILDNIIKGENGFCCLCLHTKHNRHLYNSLSIEINDTGKITAAMDILKSVFGMEIQECLSIFENVCEECFKTIISFYTFTQTCNQNVALLMKALNGLYESIGYNINAENITKSLFVTLKLDDFTSDHLYDSHTHKSAKEALKRFQNLKPNVLSLENQVTPQRKTVEDGAHKVLQITDMVLDPNNETMLQCKVCLKGFPTMWNLRIHYMKTHAPKTYISPKRKANGKKLMVKKSQNVICSKCGKPFKNQNTLVRHELTHQLKIICPDCGRAYKNRLTFKNHIEYNVCKKERRANPADAQYTCDYCGKKYTQKMSLRVHIQYEHGNYKAHICKWCGKKFWAQSRLKAHIVKHTREKNFSCSICQGKFVTKESLLYHTRLHTGEKPYRCSLCERTFISASRRACHMKTYHLLSSEECDICHSKFTSRAYLQKHKKIHGDANVSKNDSTVQEHNKDLSTDCTPAALNNKTNEKGFDRVELD